MMSVANWTTRFLPGRAQGSEMQPDGQCRRSGHDGPSDESSGDSPADSPADSQGEPPARRDLPASLIGSRVGAYLITKRLGAGGVGEVFKAVDVMLKREVAIKVLR